jgi:hypothetical protein
MMTTMAFQAEAATEAMVVMKSYSDAGCTTQTKQEWEQKDVCLDASGGYILSCSSERVTSQMYSDTTCTSMMTTTASQPAGVMGYTNGLWDHGTTCTQSSANEWLQVRCTTPAKSASYAYWGDATCTAAAAYTGAVKPSSGQVALDECEILIDSTTGQTYARKRDVLASGNYSEQIWSANSCSGTPTTTFESASCFQDDDSNGVSRWVTFMIDPTSTSGGGTASSGTGTGAGTASSSPEQSLMTAAIIIAFRIFQLRLQNCE